MTARIQPFRLWGILKVTKGRVENGRWLAAVSLEPQSTTDMFELSMKPGRFNPPHSFPVLYLSEDDERCRESIRRLSLQDEDPLGWRVIAVLEVHLSSVLDLSNRSLRSFVGLSLKDLTDPYDCSVTQTVGVAARSEGFEGVIYPRPGGCGGRNLAVFMDRVNPTGLIAVA